jgi:hypothetical protein
MLGGFIPAGWVFAFKPLPLPQACCMRRVCHGRALVPNIRVVAVVAGSTTKEVGGDIHGGKLVVTPSSGGGRRGRKERAAVTQEQWSDGAMGKFESRWVSQSVNAEMQGTWQAEKSDGKMWSWREDRVVARHPCSVVPA